MSRSLGDLIARNIERDPLDAPEVSTWWACVDQDAEWMAQRLAGQEPIANASGLPRSASLA